MESVFEARTPDGHVYRIFEDGSTQGFPAGTIVANGWMRLLNFERGLRIQADKESLVPVCCSETMRPVSFARGFVCLVCGETQTLAPRNRSVTADLEHASSLVTQGRQGEIPVDVRIA